MNSFERILTRLFRYEDLTVDGTGQYIHRWQLWAGANGRRVYLHKIVGSDWAREPHDHPKDFISIGLWGSYFEEVYEVKGTGVYPSCGTVLAFMAGKSKTFRAPWVRKFKSDLIHRLVADGNPVWTMCITGPDDGSGWGFWNPDGTRTDSDEYFAQYFEERT